MSGGKIGDFNNDGIDDLFVGAPNAAIDAGSGFVIFGRKSFSSEIDVAKLRAGEGFKITGFASNNETQFGASMCYAGKSRGTVRDEFVVSARSNNKWTGAVYRFHNLGKKEFPVEINKDDLTPRDITVIDGNKIGSSLGWMVGGGIDINGDGISDVTMSVPAVSQADNGVAVVFGRPPCDE